MTAYTAAFGPEKKRTEMFIALAAAITEPPALKERIGKAATALTTYQGILKMMDDKLAEALTPEDKARLEHAQQDTSDVIGTLKEVSNLVKTQGQGAPVQVAYAAFQEARATEVAAGHLVDTSCPDDIE